MSEENNGQRVLLKVSGSAFQNALRAIGFEEGRYRKVRVFQSLNEDFMLAVTREFVDADHTNERLYMGESSDTLTEFGILGENVPFNGGVRKYETEAGVFSDPCFTNMPATWTPVIRN